MHVRPRLLLEWIPVVVLMIVMGSVVIVVSWPSKPATQHGPITVNPFRLLTPGPYKVGQTISMANGLCNISDKPVSVNLKLGVKEVSENIVAARDVTVLQQNMFAISPGCVKNSEVLTGPLPAAIGVGKWRVYLTLCIPTKPCETTESDVFEVIL